MKSKMISEIQGFENCYGYEIYENGEVHSYIKRNSGIQKEPQKILKGYPNTKGYLLVDLSSCRRAVKIHRLVALAFIPNEEKKSQVNHLDGNKQNNEVNNLQWVTNGENQKHAFKMGLNTAHKKEKNYQYLGEHENCKSVRQLDLDGNLIAIHKSLSIAGRSLNKGYSSISKVCNGKIKTAYGYKWEFLEKG